ncbi:hypothetical protein [Melittangium boletus]|nr:hypothetical protein [Melittangium boletus]
MPPSDEKNQPLIIFWSWQADSDATVNRNFIGDCLLRAAKKVGKSESIVLTVDRDTQGVGGSPSIAETILKKIRSSDVFVFDATHAYRTPRPAPNPNVALELGYALAVLGENRVIGVRNTAGTRRNEEPPFDFRHRRWPIDYELRPLMHLARMAARRSEIFARPFHARRAAVRDELVKALEQALVGALKEPKSGALRADVDLGAAARLWAHIHSKWMQDWVSYRLNIPQYEERETLDMLRSYLKLSYLPENQFKDDKLSSRHNEVLVAMQNYIRISANVRIPDGAERFVISAKANSERIGYKENDEIYDRQVSAITESVRAVWSSWEIYVQELRSRYPEIVVSASPG